MKLTNYENSKRLAELNFKAEYIRYWDDIFKEIQVGNNVASGYPAYDLETLINALPESNSCGYYLILKKDSSSDSIGYYNEDEDSYNIKYYRLTKPYYSVDESLADCAARLLIQLIEQGIVKTGGIDD